jgi:hypothetical protein
MTFHGYSYGGMREFQIHGAYEWVSEKGERGKRETRMSSLLSS